jgi:hypothetical protein
MTAQQQILQALLEHGHDPEEAAIILYEIIFELETGTSVQEVIENYELNPEIKDALNQI